MSRAEKFIQDYTRNCSNELLRSGKDSFTNIPRKGEYHEWLTPDQARKAVEIAREEIAEKVCEFLENELDCYIKARVFTIEYQRLENDLKQAMKDE